MTDDEFPTRIFRNWLHEAVTRLSADAEVQRAFIQETGVRAGKLFDEFDDAWRPLQDHDLWDRDLPPRVRETVAALNSALWSLDSDQWNLDSLTTPQWQNIRALASAAREAVAEWRP